MIRFAGDTLIAINALSLLLGAVSLLLALILRRQWNRYVIAAAAFFLIPYLAPQLFTVFAWFRDGLRLLKGYWISYLGWVSFCVFCTAVPLFKRVLSPFARKARSDRRKKIITGVTTASGVVCATAITLFVGIPVGIPTQHIWIPIIASFPLHLLSHRYYFRWTEDQGRLTPLRKKRIAGICLAVTSSVPLGTVLFGIGVFLFVMNAMSKV